MSEQINYTDAFRELQAIVTEIENGEISVDELSQKVKRASQLIKICKMKMLLMIWPQQFIILALIWVKQLVPVLGVI